MKSRIVQWISALLALTFILVPTTRVTAQSPAFAEVVVDLWPEYDRPEMLAILHIQLPPDVSLPTQVTVRIPARVGEPHAVAVAEADGSLLVAPYERTVEGDWALLHITASTPALQIEYYDPLRRDGDQRQYTFQWPGSPAVEHMVLRVQQPPNAQQFTLTPSTSPAQRGEDGLMYYVSDLGQLDEGETFTLDLTYTKPNDDLTVQSLQVQPSAPLAEAKGQVNVSDWLPWVLGALGVLLIAGGLIWYWRSGTETTSSRPKRRHRPRRPAATTPPDEARYCPQCGARAQPGDRFCRHCGTPLR